MTLSALKIVRAKTAGREIEKPLSARPQHRGRGPFVGAVTWSSTTQEGLEMNRPRFGRGRLDYFLARAFFAFFAFFAFLAIMPSFWF
jgi:hypothetical protein